VILLGDWLPNGISQSENCIVYSLFYIFIIIIIIAIIIISFIVSISIFFVTLLNSFYLNPLVLLFVYSFFPSRCRPRGRVSERASVYCLVAG